MNFSSIFNDLRICITTIAVIQCPHALTFTIRKDHPSHPQQWPIKKIPIFPSGVLACHKTNMTAITSIILHLVSSKVHFLDQAHVHQPVYTTVLRHNECVPATVRMCFATASVIFWEKAHENDFHLAKTKCVVCGFCVVCEDRCWALRWIGISWHQLELLGAVHIGMLLFTRKNDLRWGGNRYLWSLTVTFTYLVTRFIWF